MKKEKVKKKNKKTPLIREGESFTLAIGTDGRRRLQFDEVIGSGGSCLVYRGKRYEGDNEIRVVIKEYYPDESNSYASYVRSGPGEPLVIKMPGHESKEQKARTLQTELDLQHRNIKRETEMNKKLLVSHDGRTNNPHVFQCREETEIEDESFTAYSSYMVIDTVEGKTLKSLLDETEKKRFEVREATGLTFKCLEVLEYLQQYKEGAFCHGDLSLDNIYLSGTGDNTSIRILDFGSGFFLNEYRCDGKDTKHVRAMADKIVDNIALGSSHPEIKTGRHEALEQARSAYRFEPDRENAKELVLAVSHMNIAVDIYAIVLNFFYMITGQMIDKDCLYADDRLLRESVYKAFYEKDMPLEADDVFIGTLCDVLIKADMMRYDTCESVREDIRELKNIADGIPTPKSLIKKLQDEIAAEKNAFRPDPLLFPQIHLVKNKKANNAHE